MTDAPSSVLEIVKDEIYAIGGSTSLDARNLSFMPDDARGWLPIQCYVARKDGFALVIDTGVGADAGAVLEGVDWALDGVPRRQFIGTRREPDNLINLPLFTRRYGFERINYSGEVTPLDFFESFEVKAAEVHLKDIYDGEMALVGGGKRIEGTGHGFEIVKTSLRVLATFWIYEPVSRTLFTSDSWGHFTSAAPEGPFRVSGSDPRFGADAVRHYIGKKFSWLRGIDTAPVIADLRGIFAERQVDRICPGYGGIIEGPDNVARIVEATVTALEDLAAEDFPGALGEFVWPKAAAMG